MGVGLLLAVVCYYLLTSGGNIVRGTIAESVSVDSQGIKLKELHYVQSNPDNDMTMSINAKETRSSVDGRVIRFNKFRIRVTPKDKPYFEMSGENGVYDRESGKIEVDGNLEGVSEDGYRLTTEHLQFNEKKGIVESADPIKIIGPLFSVVGRGLSVDLNKQTAKILSNVNAVIHWNPSM